MSHPSSNGAGFGRRFFFGLSAKRNRVEVGIVCSLSESFPPSSVRQIGMITNQGFGAPIFPKVSFDARQIDPRKR